MEELDMNYLCSVMGSLSGVPIRLYDGDELEFFYSTVHLPKDPIVVYKDRLWAIGSHVGYYATRHFNFYGIVNHGMKKLIIGPTRQVANSEAELRELAFRADVSPEDMEDFIAGMKSIVRMPVESILQMLCTINYVWNNEKLTLEDISITESDQQGLKQLLETQQSAHRMDAVLADVQEHPNVHNSFDAEQQLLHMIRKGDCSAMKRWLSSAPAIRGGTLAADQLRQVKNTFVVSVTLVSRAAIQGGMDVEDAFSLSDAFIQKAELLNTPNQLTNLQYHMVLEFTERVDRIRQGKQPTALVLAVRNYIQHHISEPIKAEKIADALYMSRPYLSAKFKQESGQSLTDFILRKKTEEAKRLLRYSGKSSAAIALYLGFSSPSHFSRVFRQYAGCNPGEYRERYN